MPINLPQSVILANRAVPRDLFDMTEDPAAAEDAPHTISLQQLLKALPEDADLLLQAAGAMSRRAAATARAGVSMPCWTIRARALRSER